MPGKRRIPADAPEGRPLRAAIYARVSSPKQKSVPQQVIICRQRCDALGFQVKYILKEEGWSAKDIDRPKLHRLLEICEEGKVDVIVIWKLDRIIRSLKDLMNTHAYFEQLGVRLHSVTEQFDTASPFGRFNFRNIASAAELERELIAERAMLGKMAQAVAGRWPTQRPPLGYRVTPERELLIEPSEAEIVRRIFKDYTSGIALTEISRQLSVEGVLTRLERTFAPSTVYKVVRNPIYIGRLTILGVEHDRQHLRLISNETWRRAEARRGRRMKNDNRDAARQAAIDSVVDDYLGWLSESVGEEVVEASEPAHWTPFDRFVKRTAPDPRRPVAASRPARHLDPAGDSADLEV